MFDVVVVTPTYVSSNPRVVKEADALAAAGLRVCVVFSQGGIEWARRDDAALLAGKPWTARPVRWSRSVAGERLVYRWSTARFHLARRLFTAGLSLPGLVERAECRTYPELAEAAAELPGRLYIGHYPEGLAAAAWASACHRARLGYDAEDLHTEEGPPTPQGRRRRERVGRIERRYLPRCSYVSAVSEGIAQAIAERYGVPEPVVVHNAFPWNDRLTIDGRHEDRRGLGVSLFWSSQVIGLDRGLDDAIRALARATRPFELHLRGSYDALTEHQLRGLAAEAGIADRLFLHRRVPPSELLARTAEHDVGLALERPWPKSRALAVSNKLFSYLLAGLAVVASDTPGQRRVLEQAPGAAVLYPPGDHGALARAIEPLLADPAELESRRSAALAAARERWNWETEGRRLVDRVLSVLDGTGPRH